MRAAVLYAPKDLRIEPVAAAPLGPGEVEVRIEAGGICGSDLHYYFDGGFGTVRLREPMCWATRSPARSRASARRSRRQPGQRVAVNPSRPAAPAATARRASSSIASTCASTAARCACRTCRAASARRWFATPRAVPVPRRMSAAQAAFAEPFAVCLHAVKQAGPLLGNRVLVTGAGPIGTLTVIAARRAGAREIVATDVLDAPLLPRRSAPTDRQRLREGCTARYAADKGYFDVMFEAWATPPALAGGSRWCGRGVVVQIGIGGDVTPADVVVVAKEIELRGTFRFQAEFALAVALIGGGPSTRCRC